MGTEDEYVDFARECIRLADRTDDPELRERLLQMAREWMAVAMEEGNLPELQEPHQTVAR